MLKTKRIKPQTSYNLNIVVHLFFLIFSLSSKSFAQPSFKWANYIGSEYVDGCSAMALDSSENIFLAGHFGLVPKSIPTNISVDFDLSANESNLTTTGESKIFVTKRDADGNLLWAREFGKGLITNNTYEYLRSHEINISSIATDLVGNVYVTGNFEGEVNFSTNSTPQILTATNSSNVYILKLDKDGTSEWSKKLEHGSNQGIANSIRIDRNKNIYTTGTFGQSISFKLKNGTIKTLNNVANESSSSIYIAKLDESGDILWVKSILNSTFDEYIAYLGGPNDAMSLDNEGNILLGGSSFSNATPPSNNGVQTRYDLIYDKDGPSEHIEKATVGSSNGFSYVMKIDSEGIFKWIARNEPIDPNPDLEGTSTVNSVTTDKNGNVYYIGNLLDGGSIDVDPTSGVKKLVPYPDPSFIGSRSFGSYDLYITKLDKDGKFIFARQINGESITQTRSITVNSGGEIFVFGNTYEGGKLDYNPLSPIQKMPSGNIGEKSYKMFLLKLTSEGKYAWAGEFGYTGFHSLPGQVAVNKTGCNIYLGSTIGTQYGPPNLSLPSQTDPHEFEPRDYDPGDGTANITTKGWRDIYFSKFSDNSAPPPSITPTGSLEFCQGDSVILDAGSGFESYKWSPNGETTQTIKVNTAGNYTVAITGDCGNQISSPITTIINPLPIIDLTPDFSVPEGTETILTASSTGVLTYNWSPSDGLSCSDCASPTVTIEQPTDYCVTIMNTDSCKTTECVKISIDLLCGELFVPNSFSPNNDKINDFLEVKVKEDCIESFEFSIFNRWGEKVFESSKITDSWDGKFEGKELDNAVFVYYLKTKLKSSAEPIIKKGNVSIIK